MAGGAAVTLLVRGSVARGRFVLDVDVEVGERTVAVTGDNGTGKTTLLRAVAGLERLQAGRMELGDAVLDEPSSRAFVPPPSRFASMIFQDALLLPFLSAVDNVAFPLRRAGESVEPARAAAAAALERLGAGHLGGRDPSTLSGGEARARPPQQGRVPLAPRRRSRSARRAGPGGDARRRRRRGDVPRRDPRGARHGGALVGDLPLNVAGS
ncbi:MAG: ATP-binding cassette domain-containing protein [Actinobacteria bacterium]|nr:ATP-binding cassette domain-containing protein [Actinomycetota bacterium]